MIFLIVLFVITPLLVFLGFDVFKKLINARITYFSLFTAALLLSITAIQFLPEVFEFAPNKTIAGLLIVAGLLLNILIEKFTNGLEHGHEHHHNHGANKQVHLGFWISYLALLIHSFLEGMPIFLSANGSTILLGLIIHNIPVVIILTQLIQKNDNRFIFRFFYISLLPLVTLMGAFVAKFLTQDNALFQFHYEYLLAFVSGIFVHLSTSLFFEFNKKDDKIVLKIFLVLMAIVISLSFKLL